MFRLFVFLFFFFAASEPVTPLALTDEMTGHRTPLESDSVTLFVATTGSDVTGDGSEGSPYATIQHAIDLAVEGDEVCVQPGTYTGAGNRDIDFLGKAITVRSCTGDPTTTIIDCQGSEAEPHRGFIFQNDEGPESVLNGFTVTNGYANDRGGGGILLDGSHPAPPPYVPDGASPTIEACRIVNNVGDGVYVIGELAAPTFSDCQFNGNEGRGYSLWYGGGIYSNCEFSLNSSEGFNFETDYYGGICVFIGCEFLGNGDNGLFSSMQTGGLNLTQCLLDGNQNCGIRAGGNEDGEIIIRDSVISNNLGAGFDTSWSWIRVEVYDSQFRGNGLQGLSMGVFGGPYVLDNCKVIGNGSLGVEVTPEGEKKSQARDITVSPVISISNCEIGLNEGGGIGGFIYFANRPFFIFNTLVYDNQGDGINLVLDSYGEPATLQVEDVTITRNNGFGITADVDSLFIHNTIVVSNGLEAVGLAEVGFVEAGCSDFFWNGGGDWIGALSPQLGINGNISEDPLFCDLASGDLSLRVDSPCLPQNHPDGSSCGMMGAVGLGCFTQEPVIAAIEDVGNDQGGQVRLIWNRSEYDEFESPSPIHEYGIYRRQDEFLVHTNLNPVGNRLAGWDFLDTVPARGDDVYQFIAPTMCDSTNAGGVCWSSFFISAMTDQPLVFFDSAPDSGYSIDNLAPGVPTSICAAYQAEGVTLGWDDQPEDDFQFHRIYRGSYPDFLPSPHNLIGETAASSWVDATSNPWGYHYMVTALDHSGNESAAGSPLQNDCLSSARDGEIPGQTVLLAAVPNPFNPTTKLSFEVAAPGHARLCVYDTAGRLVRTLVDEHLDAGPHQEIWDGRDYSGRMSAAGVYLYRLEVGKFSETKRMVLMK